VVAEEHNVYNSITNCSFTINKKRIFFNTSANYYMRQREADNCRLQMPPLGQTMKTTSRTFKSIQRSEGSIIKYIIHVLQCDRLIHCGTCKVCVRVRVASCRRGTLGRVLT
jgi:hypothetical protein